MWCIERFSDLRTLHGAVSERVSHYSLGGHLLGLGHKLVVNTLMDEGTGPSAAVLAMIVHDASVGPPHCLVNCRFGKVRVKWLAKYKLWYGNYKMVTKIHEAIVLKMGRGGRSAMPNLNTQIK